MIDALKQLKSNLEAKPTRGRSYEIISYIVDACLQRDDVYEKLTFEAATLLHCCGTAAEREMDPQKWMPSISVLQKALNLTQTSEARRLRFGYSPGGGRGNVSLYWLELAPEEAENQSGREVQPDEVTYRRSAPGSIKPSITARFFFKKGEIKNRSVVGTAFLTSIMLASLTWIAMLSLVILSLVLRDESINMGSLFHLLIAVIGFLFIWKQSLAPWFKVIDDCVVKAPLGVAAIFEDSCEIEMFRHERSRWTRLVRFSADCPLCGSNIELRQGKPDHVLPLVGRCIESPHAHVYSFDRMTLRGKYIGP
ncbi:hypothetical protein CNQ84_11405 [Pseudomonas abyssi]|uniref:Uncharacterized protein n=1 Tax=Pseudomonas abyssi TaxID=170540 RepID=A0A2A3MHH6_9PSED|nr:hypothetical protein [Pseudomonas abyssi]PBK04231.1 hypothetical protein CNQ84_11405 [Pseudomonas abyssi]